MYIVSNPLWVKGEVDFTIETGKEIKKDQNGVEKKIQLSETFYTPVYIFRTSYIIVTKSPILNV